MTSQDELDRMNAAGEGMIEREPHHPTNTDPPTAAEWAAWGEYQDALAKYRQRVGVTLGEHTRAVERQTSTIHSQGKAALTIVEAVLGAVADTRDGSEDAERSASTPVSVTVTLPLGILREAGLRTQKGYFASAKPAVGTRVRAKRYKVYDYKSGGMVQAVGTVVEWDEDVKMPVVQWDGQGAEACEPSEYEVVPV